LSNTILAPFIKWGNYKSQLESKPDVLELQVVEVETFDTAYSTNVRVRQRIGDDWEERILPLKSFESANTSLQKEWQKAENKKQVKIGKRFVLKTWLGQSKHGRPIRRFVLDF